jgi:ribosomal protein S18 acetylase RimI-like enzyme
LLIYLVCNAAGSYNGSTHPSGGCYLGPNPSPAALHGSTSRLSRDYLDSPACAGRNPSPVAMKIIYQGKTRTGKEIVVRYPEMDDLEKMLDFINTVSDEKTFITYQGEHETLESEKKFLQSTLDQIQNKKTVHLLAFHNDALVGSSDIRLMEKTEKHLGIFGLIIKNNFRNDGIGKILAELTEKEAKNELPDLKIITLKVYAKNSIAKNLYDKMGFIEYGRLPNGIIREGAFDDTIFMYKI